MTRGFDRTEHDKYIFKHTISTYNLSILVDILEGSTDLEVFISFISDSTSSSFIGVRKNEFTIESFK